MIRIAIIATALFVTIGTAQAQHFLPNPHKGAADAVFRQAEQQNAERESKKRAYVPPPPAPNSTRLPRDNKLTFTYAQQGYELPLTFARAYDVDVDTISQLAR